MRSSDEASVNLFLIQLRQRFPKVRLIGALSNEPFDATGRVVVVDPERESFAVDFSDKRRDFDLRGASVSRVQAERATGMILIWQFKLPNGDSFVVEEAES